MKYNHVPVLKDECIEMLDPSRGGVFIDCTAGGGGHSYEIAKMLPSGSKLICIDRDDEAIMQCRKKLYEFGTMVSVIKANYDEIGFVLDTLEIKNVTGALWDLGVSSKQLDDPERGFSYMHDGPLDMRMDTDATLSAYNIVNDYPEDELKRVIRDYGEERFAQRIARNICKYREEKKIEGTLELADIISSSIPGESRRKEKQHPAKRTFQAIRIEVNGELSSIRPSIEAVADRMEPGGRLAVITFQSLEDRIVKQTFATLVNPCTCPPDIPVCVCGKVPQVRLLNKKPITASDEEIETNPRARSAKLRCAEKI